MITLVLSYQRQKFKYIQYEKETYRKKGLENIKYFKIKIRVT